MRRIQDHLLLLFELARLRPESTAQERQLQAAHQSVPEGSVECRLSPGWRYNFAGRPTRPCSPANPPWPSELPERPPAQAEDGAAEVSWKANPAGHRATRGARLQDRPWPAGMIQARVPRFHERQRPIPRFRTTFHG